jgi:hypothetical protein
MKIMSRWIPENSRIKTMNQSARTWNVNSRGSRLNKWKSQTQTQPHPKSVCAIVKKPNVWNFTVTVSGKEKPVGKDANATTATILCNLRKKESKWRKPWQRETKKPLTPKLWITSTQRVATVSRPTAWKNTVNATSKDWSAGRNVIAKIARTDHVGSRSYKKRRKDSKIP